MNKFKGKICKLDKKERRFKLFSFLLRLDINLKAVIFKRKNWEFNEIWFQNVHERIEEKKTELKVLKTNELFLVLSVNFGNVLV